MNGIDELLKADYGQWANKRQQLGEMFWEIYFYINYHKIKFCF